MPEEGGDEGTLLEEMALELGLVSMSHGLASLMWGWQETKPGDSDRPGCLWSRMVTVRLLGELHGNLG